MGMVGLQFLPKNPTFENFTWVMQTIPIGIYMVNTFIQCAIVIVCQLTICSLAGYAFVFFEFPLKKLLFTIILITMMIPGDVVIITNYIQIQRWKLTDTHIGMALPYLVGGMGIFLLRQFYLTLPKELKDAAEIDGCTDMGFFFRVAVPLSVPSLASLAIYEFISIYNRYFWPLLVTNKDSMRTIQLGMAMLEGGEAGKTPHILAGASLCILPAILVFIIGQKYLVKGMTAGAIKG
ncbi:MAG: carbohydrate ABC transporter permease [Sphaerochaetaceae bacterium]|nr:carbohydrate ABC transporter permease [Sphaerochaetaceae bacterium]